MRHLRDAGLRVGHVNDTLLSKMLSLEGDEVGPTLSLKEMYEDERKRIAEKGIVGAISEHKT